MASVVGGYLPGPVALRVSADLISNGVPHTGLSNGINGVSLIITKR